MNYVWHHDGYHIGSVTTNRWDGSQMWTSGYATTENVRDFGTMIQWEATALQSGWYIVLTRSTGKVGEYQGVTFNLPLEVAAAMRRLL